MNSRSFLRTPALICLLFASALVHCSIGYAVGSVSGTVLDATGNPIPFASIYAQDPVTFIGYNRSADGLGDYEILNMTPGSYRIRAFADGYAGAYQDGSTYPEDNPATVTVPDIVTVTDIDITLPDGGSISGTVTDESTGLPVPFEYVYVDTDNSPYRWWSTGNSTDSMGKYEVRGLPDRSDYVVGIEGGDYVPAYYDGANDFSDADLLSISGESHLTGIDLSLTLGGVLRTAVFLPSGLPAGPVGTPQILDANLNHIEKDSNDDLWFATNSGVMSIVDSVTRAIHPYNSALPGDEVRDLSISPSDTRFYATNQGIARHSGMGAVEAITTSNSNLPYNDCTAIEAVSNSSVFIGSPTSDFTVWDGATTFTNHTFSDRGEPSSSIINELTYDPTDNEVLIGTDQNGMTIYDITGGTFSRFTTGDGLPSGQIHAIAVDSNGVEWIGTSSGIYLRDPGNPDTTYTTADGLPSNFINDIFISSATQVWIATSGGVAHYDNGSFTTYTTSNSNLFTNICISILDCDGDIYIGSSSGLDILSGGVFHHINRENWYVSLYIFDAVTGFSRSGGSSSTIGYAMTGLPTGNYTLRASASGYPSVYYDGVSSEANATPIAVQEGMETAQRYVIQLLPYGGIVGSVTDSMGSPANSGTVRFYPVGETSQITSSNVSGGSYQNSQLPGGDYYVAYSVSGSPVTFYPGVFDIADADIVHVTGGETTQGIDITVPSSTNGSISGQARDSSGNPYPFVSVLVSGVFGTSNFKNTTTDKNGSYIIDDLTPGNYSVSFSPFGLPTLYYDSTFEFDQLQSVGVGSGEDVTGIDLVVPSFTPGSISGVVEDSAGNPVQGAVVELYGGLNYPSQSTGADGLFSFTDLPPHTDYDLNAGKEDFIPGEITNLALASGGNIGPVTLTLTEYAPTSVSGQVVDVSGNEIWGMNVSFGHVASNYSVQARTDWEGRYSIPSLPPGSANVSGFFNGYNSLNQTVDLSTGVNTRDFVMTTNGSSASLSGVVTDMNGAPQPGIQVDLSGASSRSFRTNKSGRFLANGMSAGTYTLELSQFGPDSTPLTGVSVAAGEMRGGLNFVIDKTLGYISGTATTQGGDPIDFPFVSPQDFSGSHYHYGDQYGKYAICAIEAPAETRLRLSEQGFREQYYDGKPNSETADFVSVPGSGEVPGIDFILDPGDSISGRVVDIFGRPLPSVSLFAQDVDTSNSESESTDSFGNYEVSGLIPGNYTVRASRSNYYQEYYDDQPVQSIADVVPVVAGVPVTGIDFQIGTGGSISGQITDASGAAYTSGTVYAYLSSALKNSVRSSSLNATGEYTLNPLPPGSYYVQASISGQPRVYYPFAYSTSSAMTVAVMEGSEITGIDIAVPASAETASVSGTITDPSGEPLSVSVRLVGVDGYSGTYFSNAGQDGKYLFTGVPPGTYTAYILENNTPNYYYGGTYDLSMATRIELTPGEEETGIDIQAVAKQFGTLSGTIRDELANPLQGVAIELFGLSGFFSTLTDSDGNYEIGGIFPQPGYTLSAFLSGYFPAEVEGIDMPANGAVTRDLVLEGFEAGMVAGKVRDVSGYPIDGVFLTITGTDVDYQVNTGSDSYGDYLFDTLPQGTFNLRLSRNGYSSITVSSVPVIVGNVTIRDVTMEDSSNTGSISGIVLDASGNPTPGIRVQVSSPTFRQFNTRHDGTYRLPSLSAGTYSVSLPNEDGPPTQDSVVVVVDEDTPDVDFNLNVTYGTIRGHILDRMGGPLAGADVDANPVNHNFFPSSVDSASSGLYILTRVLSDNGKDYRVSAELDGYVETYYEDSISSSNATVVTVPSGGDAEGIDITLGPGAMVSGSVVDGQTGLPIPSGTVFFSGTETSYNTSFSGGFYQINTLPPGDFTLRTSVSGYSTEYYNNVAYNNQATTLTITEGQVLEGIDFSPTESVSISGLVRDESGVAYTSGSIRAYDITQDPSNYFSGSISSGMYTISNIPAGTFYVFASISGKPSIFYPSEYTTATALMVVTTPGETNTGIDITVPSDIPSGSISGTLLDRFASVDTSISARVMGVDGTSWNRTYNLDSSTGQYSAEDLLPGTYLVGLDERSTPTYYYGNTYDSEMATKVILGPGEAKTGIDIMAIEIPQANLQGVVRDQGGTPIPGAEFSLSFSRASYSNVFSRSDGSYMFMNIFPGDDYRVTVERNGYYEKVLEDVQIPEGQTTTLDITLDSFQPTTIMGQVENASGYPVVSASVRISGGNPNISYFLSTDPFGEYRSDNVPPGTYTVQASRSGYETQSVSGVTTTPGSPVIQDFTLDYATNVGVVEGTVTDSEGNPAYGIFVRSSNSRSTTTNLDGTYQLVNLSAGTYTISLPNEDDSGDPSVENVVVVADESTTGVDFNLAVPYGTISGTVFDEAMNPQADSTVRPEAVDHNWNPSSVQSGIDGNYIAGRLRTDGGRSYIVYADKDGFIRTYYGDVIEEDIASVIDLALGDSFSPAPIRMKGGSGISGLVKEDGTGRLITSGSIRASNDDWFFSTSINNAGVYLFDDLPAGDYELSTSISKYVTEYYNDVNYRDDQTLITLGNQEMIEGIDFTPERGGQISGVVSDASGNPITSGTIYTYETSRTNDDRQSTNLNSSGEYSFNNRPAGNHYVYAAISGKPNVFYGDVFFAEDSTQVSVIRGVETMGIDITIPNEVAPGSISGNVTDLFGEPYNNLRIRLRRADGTGGTTNTNADSEGNYSYSDILPGLYRVAIQESGRPDYYHGDTYDADMADPVRVDVGADVTGIDIMAPERNDGSVSGIARTDDGSPVNGLQVQLTGVSTSLFDTTGPDGSFNFPFVVPGTYELIGSGNGFFRVEQNLVVEPGMKLAGIVLVMGSSEFGSIAGTVTDASGNILEDANVNLYGPGGYTVGSTRSTRFGDYYYQGLQAGTYSMNANLSGYQSQSISGVVIENGLQTTRNIALDISSNQGRVSGSILDSNGRPAYRIQIRSEGPSNRTAYTYPDGSYLLSGLSTGTYRIYLPDETGPVVENLNIEVTGGETVGDVTFELDSAYGTIAGKVLESGTVNPVRGGNVRADVFRDGGYIDESDTNNQGNYLIGRVPVGATDGVRLLASKDGYGTVYWMNHPAFGGANPVVLDGFGNATNINFGLDAEGIIQGRLTDFFGTPLVSANANASISTASGSNSFGDNTNSNGWFEIRSMPMGDYTLRFTSSNFASEYYDNTTNSASAQNIVVTPGSVQEFFATLTPNNAIGGTVTDASGNPVTNAYVDLYRMGVTNPSRVYVDGSGNYSFQGISSGDYRLRAASPDFIPQWWLGQPSASLATTLNLPEGTLRGEVNFAFSGQPGGVYDLFTDGLIDARDLLELMNQGNTADSVLFDFTRYWMDANTKVRFVE